MAIDLTKVDVPSFKIPSPKEWPAKIKKTLKEWRRVYKITKKPGKEEYLAVVKVTGRHISNWSDWICNLFGCGADEVII